MHRASFSTWLRNGSALHSFGASEEGATAPIFAICASLVVFAAGMAIDSSRLSTARIQVQAATDSAALAAAAAYGTGNANYRTIADAYFGKTVSQYRDLANANIVTNVTVDTANNTLTMTASGDIPTTLTRIGGFNDMSLGGNSSVPTASGVGSGTGSGAGTQSMAAATSGGGAISTTVSLPIFSDHHKGQIVLVMDYSSSMTEYVGGKKKYLTMRDEASKLVKDLSQNFTNQDVEFGLVPFSHAVRVTMPKNFYYGQTGTTATTNCIDDRNHPLNLDKTTPDTSTKNNSSKFFTTSCTNFSTNKLNVKPLSTDHAGTQKQITDMLPYGNTHIALGMETAWHLLSPNTPYEAAEYPGKNVLRSVVLLTDGQQTSPGNGPNNVLSVAQAESNLEELCRKMKIDGIRVVTVSFDLADATTKQRLSQCASEVPKKKPTDPTERYYYDTNTNKELADAFDLIRDSLARNMFVSK